MSLVLRKLCITFIWQFPGNFVELDSEPAYDDPVVQVVSQVHIVQADHPLPVSGLGAGGVALHVLLLLLVNS